MKLDDRIAARLTKAWGFRPPKDLLRFWRLVRGHEDALFESGVRLSWDADRWESDPPELFTVAEGDTDGLHWGYVFHEPGKAPGHVAWFYARDGYPIDGAAPTLVHAILYQVKLIREAREEELADIHEVGENDKELERDLVRVKKLEAVLAKAAGPRKRFTPKKEAAPTLDGLGVRAPRGSFVAIDRRKLVKELGTKKLAAWLERGHALIREKKAGSALQIARDALAVLPTEKQDAAVLLAVAAYEALERPLLARTFAPRLAKIKKRLGAKKPPKVDNRVSTTMEEAMLDPKRVEQLVLSVWDDEPKTPDLEAIARMTNLRELVLRGYPLGDLPRSFARLKKLRSLELFECKLRTIPKVLGRLRLDDLEIIQSVTVDRPKKEVRVPPGLAMPKLRSLHLVACGLRSVPKFVLAAKKLRFLSLNGNHLRELPEGIGNLRLLDYFSASENSLSALPASFAKLRKLDSVWLGSNRFAEAPEVLGALPLRDLDIGKNPLARDKDERAKLKKLCRKAKIHFT